MSPLEKLQRNRQLLSKAELAAAEYIIASPINVVQMTLTELAAKSHSSTAAIIRMCQRIGYEGFKEFKFSMSRYLVSVNPDNLTEPDNEPANSLESVTSTYMRFISLMRDTLTMKDIRQFVTDIYDTRSVTIFGVNRTGFAAMQLSYRLSRLGVASRPITDPIVMTDYASILGKDDICIIFTIRGKGSKNYGAYMQQMKKQGCHVILITMDPKLVLLKYAHLSFVLPRISKTSELSFLDDQVIFFVFIEIVLREFSLYYFEKNA